MSIGSNINRSSACSIYAAGIPWVACKTRIVNMNGVLYSIQTGGR